LVSITEANSLTPVGRKNPPRDGIKIYSPDGDFHLPHPQVFQNSGEIGPCDLVIISLKATANAVLNAILPPLLHEETMVLTLQNGLGNEEFLASLAGADRVLGGLCFVCLNRPTPASVVHIGHGKLSLGEFGRSPLPRTYAVHKTFLDAGIDASVVSDLAEERWRKLVWNIPFNGLAVSRGGVTVDQILANPELLAECRALMQETIATANALGFPISPDYGDLQIERTHSMGAYQPSTLIDFLAGNELEIEPIWGAPLRAAQNAGVPTPHLADLYGRLKIADRKTAQ
jgi:2-dehydropantoate 2-reductase